MVLRQKVEIVSAKRKVSRTGEASLPVYAPKRHEYHTRDLGRTMRDAPVHHEHIRRVRNVTAGRADLYSRHRETERSDHHDDLAQEG